jgi:hypothetical protein
MFESVSRSRLDGGRLLLTGGHDRWEELELDGAVLYLRGTGSDLVLRTITEFDNVWLAGGERISAELYVRHTNYVEMPTLRPVSLAENAATRFGISAEISFGSQHVYGFQGEEFLGRAQKAFLYVVSADTTRTAVEFHGGETDGASPFVNISIQLSYEVFQSTFKPLWLGSPRAAVDVTVGVCGFRQEGQTPDDASDFVMASGAWSAELKSLSLAITSRSS